MRIVMTIGQLAVGGAEMQAARLARALVRRGHDVTILTKQPIAEAVRAQAGEARIRKVFSLRGARGVGKYAFAISLLGEILRRRPDVIHVHQLVEFHLLPALLVGAVSRRPVLAKASGAGVAAGNSDLLWLGRSRLWGRRLVRLVADRLGCAVAVSQEMFDELRGAGFERVELIPNGVEVGPPAALAAPLDVLFVGRLHRVKGVDVLLRAWKRIEARVAPSCLTLCGAGPARPALEALAAELGLSRVRFRGEVTRPFDEIPGAVFVLPSRAEGLSNALLEAMGRGLPVVATAVGGNRDLVQDGRTGLLVASEDPAALAEALARLAGDLALARRLGHAAREATTARYGLDRVAARYEALYQLLLGRVPLTPATATPPCAASPA